VANEFNDMKIYTKVWKDNTFLEFDETMPNLLIQRTPVSDSYQQVKAPSLARVFGGMQGFGEAQSTSARQGDGFKAAPVVQGACGGRAAQQAVRRERSHSRDESRASQQSGRVSRDSAPSRVQRQSRGNWGYSPRSLGTSLTVPKPPTPPPRPAWS